MHKLALFRSRVTHYLQMSLHGLWADFCNFWSKQNVLGDTPVVVSLTTHGIRVPLVHRTIESIGRGQLKPQRLILWLASEEKERSLPRALQRLQARGLEVQYTEDCGPHTKYYPYVCSETSHQVAMVTADDDIWYPAFWLRGLWQAHQMAPQYVHCYRARRVLLDDNRLGPYKTWHFVDDDQPDPRVLATGVGGVIYPPRLLDCIRRAGAAFWQCCPKADDLWLHVTTLRSGFLARQLGPNVMEFNTMPYTQLIGLQKENVALARNDVQARATYTMADLARMRAWEQSTARC